MSIDKTQYVKKQVTDKNGKVTTVWVATDKKWKDKKGGNPLPPSGKPLEQMLKDADQRKTAYEQAKKEYKKNPSSENKEKMEDAENALRRVATAIRTKRAMAQGG